MLSVYCKGHGIYGDDVGGDDDDGVVFFLFGQAVHGDETRSGWQVDGEGYQAHTHTLYIYAMAYWLAYHPTQRGVSFWPT